MTRLRETIDRKKDEFRRSYVEFDGKPASLDDSIYKREYGHQNGEGMMRITRAGKDQMLFFMKNKGLWKVIDVYKLGEASKWGIDYAQATEKLGKRLGAPGRKLAADPEKMREADEADWADENTHLRAIKVSAKKLGLGYVDLSVETNLQSLRPARKKAPEDDGVDPAVKAVMRDTSKDPRVNPNADTGSKDSKKKPGAKQ
jgi:hypothetical protein